MPTDMSVSAWISALDSVVPDKMAPAITASAPAKGGKPKKGGKSKKAAQPTDIVALLSGMGVSRATYNVVHIHRTDSYVTDRRESRNFG